MSGLNFTASHSCQYTAKKPSEDQSNAWHCFHFYSLNLNWLKCKTPSHHFGCLKPTSTQKCVAGCTQVCIHYLTLVINQISKNNMSATAMRWPHASWQPARFSSWAHRTRLTVLFSTGIQLQLHYIFSKNRKKLHSVKLSLVTNKTSVQQLENLHAWTTVRVQVRCDGLFYDYIRTALHQQHHWLKTPNMWPVKPLLCVKTEQTVSQQRAHRNIKM